MIVSSHQLVLLPWIGFWQKMAQSDVMILSEGMDFSPRDYQHRFRLHDVLCTLELDKRTTSGPLKYVQVKSTEKAVQRLEREIMVKRYPHHPRLYDVLCTLRFFDKDSPLATLNALLIAEVSRLLGLKTKLMYCGDLPEGPTKTMRLRNRVELVVGTDFTYLAGQGAEYLDEQEFGHPVIRQVLSPDLPKNSIVQLIAQTGEVDLGPRLRT